MIEVVTSFITTHWDVLFGGIGTTVVGLLMGWLVARKKPSSDSKKTKIVVNYQSNAAADTVKELASLVEELTQVNDQKLNAESISLQQANEVIEDLKKSKESLEKEISEYKKLKIKKEEDVQELHSSWDKVKSLFSSKSEPRTLDVSGMWKGTTGRLRLAVNGNSVNGEYDWGKAKNVGRLEGTIANNVIEFTWSWKKHWKASEGTDRIHVEPSGVGYLLVDEGGNLMRGGWFPSLKEIDLDKAQKGAYDSIMNSWIFFREE